MEILQKNIIQHAKWAQTQLGTDIPLFQSAEGCQNGLLLIGGVHGDEPEGVELAQQTLRWLQSEPNTLQTPWALIPCLNPDGVALRQRMNANAVDLNRNYPSADWSPEAAKARYNPGPHPGSENEIQALVKLIQVMQPRMIIHFHSYKPCIVYAGNEALPVAELLGDATGYKVIPDIGYPTPGSLSSYAWTDLGIPVICIEEEDGVDRTTIWPRFHNVVKGIIQNFDELMTPTHKQKAPGLKRYEL